ncbi:MAG: DUF4274 domain-containing protein [Lewinella sp.]
MAISWIRKATIRFHFFQLSFRSRDGEKLPDRAIFDKLTSEELHYLASIHNWDDDPTILRWIVESSKCDLGTAIMIFWLAEPDCYFMYKTPPVEEFELEIWALLQLILEKIRTEGFLTGEQSFIPVEAGYEIHDKAAIGIWTLPEVLQSGIHAK